MEAKVYNQEGKEVSKISLSEKVFGLPWNSDLVHQVVTSMMNNARASVAHTKDRSDVRGGGKKPWRQKGTGRARHGSTRSPLWVGGGVTFGPRNEKDYSRTISKKMRAKALYTVLSKKMRDGEVVFVDSLSMKEPKAKVAKHVLESLALAAGGKSLAAKRKNSAAVYIPGKDAVVMKSFQNFGNVHIEEVRNMNPVELLKYKHVVIASPAEAVKFLEGKMAKSK
jgi:large subunit ribosomal protein L4